MSDVADWAFGSGEDTGAMGTGHYRNQNRYNVNDEAYGNTSYDDQMRQDLLNRRNQTDARQAQTVSNTKIAPTERAGNAQVGPAAQAGTFQAGQTDINRSEDSQMRARQNGMLSELESQMQGRGAAQKLIDEKARAASDENRKALMSALAANGGSMGAAGARRALLDTTAQTNADINRQAAQDRLAAQSAAQDQYGNLATSARGQDLGVASDQARMRQEVNLANMGEAGNTSRFNAGATNEMANADANRRQQSMLANAEAGNARSLAQAQLDAETKRTNMESYYRNMGMNDEMARYYTDQVLAGDEANRQAAMQREGTKVEQDLGREGMESKNFDSAAGRKAGAFSGMVGAAGSVIGGMMSDERSKENKNPVADNGHYKSSKFTDEDVTSAMNWNARLDRMKSQRENLEKNTGAPPQERAGGALAGLVTQPMMQLMKPDNADAISGEQRALKSGASVNSSSPNAGATSGSPFGANSSAITNNSASAISVPSGGSAAGGKALSSFDFKTLVKPVSKTGSGKAMGGISDVSPDTSMGVDKRDWKKDSKGQTGMNVMGPFEKSNDWAMTQGWNPGQEKLYQSGIIPTGARVGMGPGDTKSNGTAPGAGGFMQALSDEKEKINVNNPAGTSDATSTAATGNVSTKADAAKSGSEFGDQSTASASTGANKSAVDINVNVSNPNANLPYATRSDTGNAGWNRRANMVDALVRAQGGSGAWDGAGRVRPSTIAFNRDSQTAWANEQTRLADAARARAEAEAAARAQAEAYAREQARLEAERKAAEEAAKIPKPGSNDVQNYRRLTPSDSLYRGNYYGPASNANMTRRLYSNAPPPSMTRDANEDADGNGVPDYIDRMNLMSDERSKKDKNKIGDKDVSDFLAALEPYTYNYKDETLPGAAKGKQLGIMAQDLEKSKIGKNLVSESEGGMKMVDAPHLTTANTALIKMQSDKQDEMNERLASLEEMFSKKKGRK